MRKFVVEFTRKGTSKHNEYWHRWALGPYPQMYNNPPECPRTSHMQRMRKLQPLDKSRVCSRTSHVQLPTIPTCDDCNNFNNFHVTEIVILIVPSLKRIRFLSITSFSFYSITLRPSTTLFLMDPGNKSLGQP